MKSVATMRNWIGWLALLAIVTGCASVERDTASITQDRPKPGRALIYFYRPRRVMGMAVGFGVWEGDRKIGGLPNGSYFVYDASLGTHTFSASTEVTKTVTINVQPGRTYYIEGTLGMGAFVGRPELTIVSEQQGPSDVAGLKRVRLAGS
jgi:hypothetical protein